MKRLIVMGVILILFWGCATGKEAEKSTKPTDEIKTEENKKIDGFKEWLLDPLGWLNAILDAGKIFK